MRAALTILALAWALWPARDRRLRGYLISLLVAAVAGEAYLLWGADSSSAYWFIYGSVTAAILSMAMLLAWHSVQRHPLSDAVVLIAGACSLLGVYFNWAPTAPLLLVLSQAGVLSFTGLLVLASIPYRLDKQAAGTVGTLWVLQAIVFHLYAAGVKGEAILTWYQIGDWLPALVVCLAMVKLGLDLRLDNHQHDAQIAIKNGMPYQA